MSNYKAELKADLNTFDRSFGLPIDSLIYKAELKADLNTFW